MLLVCYSDMQGEEYKSFLRATNKLAKCDVLVVKLTTEWHAYEPSLLYLLRKPAGTRKVVVHLPWTTVSFRLLYLYLPFCFCASGIKLILIMTCMDFPFAVSL